MPKRRKQMGKLKIKWLEKCKASLKSKLLHFKVQNLKTVTKLVTLILGKVDIADLTLQTDKKLYVTVDVI